MKLREFPGALALGLLASLVAHAALFGGEHEMGGAYHAQILTVALAGLGGLAVAFGALAWSGAAHAADGSILGSRLAARLPGLAPLLVATGGWFALIEHLEPAHELRGLIAVVAALCVAAWLLLGLAKGLLRGLAGAIVAIARTPFAPRRPVRIRRAAPVLVVTAAPLVRRRFPRPPPR